jgi:hypothetical protein
MQPAPSPKPTGLCAKMTSMSKIIYRSLIKDLFYTFFLTLAFLNCILMMEKILRLSRLLSGVGATVADMLRVIIYLQPQILMLTIPMSLLLSVLLVYGRMHLNSEIIILKTAGMDYTRISLPSQQRPVKGRDNENYRGKINARYRRRDFQHVV